VVIAPCCLTWSVPVLLPDAAASQLFKSGAAVDFAWIEMHGKSQAGTVVIQLWAADQKCYSRRDG
jgi:hypothetical protein